MRLAAPLAIASILLAGSAGAETVNILTVSGGINPAVADYIQKGITSAETSGAEALVLELDTPGGLLSSTKDIVSAILNAEVPVLVFVSPRGAWAGSAGTFITMAGHVAAMAPGTSIGAAHPVSIMPSGQESPPSKKQDGEEPRKTQEEVMAEKVENFTAAFAESIAEERERNVEWAIEAVRNSVAITGSEALEKNVIDLIAEDLDDLLTKVDGRTVRVGREEVELATADARVVRIEMGVVNRIFDVISDPQIAFLLILAGLLGLYVEFTQPGMVGPGIAGVICLILAGLALQIIPFNWLGLLLILLGVALLIAEIFVTSFGLLFAGGLAALAIGGYMIFDVPAQSDLSVPVGVIAGAVLAVGLFGGIVVFGLSRAMLRPQQTGVEKLVGETAVVDTDIEREGRVFLHGELWTAEADEPIVSGEKVRIVGVRDLKLQVARVSESTEGGS
jgi:membrane-bound serine protease (ClpP class)